MVPTLRFLAFVSALLGISASAQSNCDRFYAVNSGDTCNSIAAQQHVPTFQLQTVNNGTIDAACDNLFPGEVECPHNIVKMSRSHIISSFVWGCRVKIARPPTWFSPAIRAPRSAVPTIYPSPPCLRIMPMSTRTVRTSVLERFCV